MLALHSLLWCRYISAANTGVPANTQLLSLTRRGNALHTGGSINARDAMLTPERTVSTAKNPV